VLGHPPEAVETSHQYHQLCLSYLYGMQTRCRKSAAKPHLRPVEGG
jgi:hypothetical protein